MLDSSTSIQWLGADILTTLVFLPSLGALGVAMASLVFCAQPYRWDVLLAVFFLSFSFFCSLIQSALRFRSTSSMG